MSGSFIQNHQFNQMNFRKKSTKVFFVFLLQCALQFNGWTSIFNQDKEQQLFNLQIIKNFIDVAYAPAEWKKECFGWDLEEAYLEAQKQITDQANLSTRQYHQILRNFINSLHDYHAAIFFNSTEKATLPFSVRSAEQRYFIDWINTQQLLPDKYQIHVGDEVIEFDDRPIQEVIDELKLKNNSSVNHTTDQALTEMRLTARFGGKGDDVPSGPIKIKIRSSLDHHEKTYQLRWTYVPECIKNPFNLNQKISLFFQFFQQTKKKVPLNRSGTFFRTTEMFFPVKWNESQELCLHDRGLGSKKSFVPILGPLLWSYEKMSKEEVLEKEGLALSWNAYIYEHGNHRIGYLRIPHYFGSKEHYEEFAKIIKHLEQETDGLIIDQLNNVGGYAEFLYDIAAMLTDRPLSPPKHRLKITQKQVQEAVEALDIITRLESDLDSYVNEEIAKEIDYQQLLASKSYFELIISEWNLGHTLTQLTSLSGIDMIYPHPNCYYSKPILMLINELVFSAGDFMAAILQDHKRATLFGMQTAGAGGCLNEMEFPNSQGISSFSYTSSLAERMNGQKIETLGVQPDITYKMTVYDLQNEYSLYAEAVNRSILRLLEADLNSD